MDGLQVKDGAPEREREGGRGTGADREREKSGHEKIRCPLCKWQPRAKDRWQCSCGHVWNTFDTRGVCPGCGYAWPWTQCLRCHEVSAHEAWYATDDA